MAAKFGYKSLAEVNTDANYREASRYLKAVAPESAPKRLKYLYEAQCRFTDTLEAWRSGDIERVGRNFRADGIGLRDDYQISGQELETMCDIARTVKGVYGERMLGGGDKGASGAVIAADAFEALSMAVDHAYPIAHPAFSDKYAVHACQITDGIVTQELS